MEKQSKYKGLEEWRSYEKMGYGHLPMKMASRLKFKCEPPMKRWVGGDGEFPKKKNVCKCQEFKRTC